MTKSATKKAGLEVTQLREALAVSELQLKEARGELGRLVRITEHSLDQQRAEVEAARADKVALERRLMRCRSSVSALIKYLRDSDLLPPELIISWLVQSGVFDPEFYLQANKDVAAAETDPGAHFLRHGFDEGRAFNDSFQQWI
jgi:hypothetical protein